MKTFEEISIFFIIGVFYLEKAQLCLSKLLQSGTETCDASNFCIELKY